MAEDPRVRFAAERTLLAWVRTGLALMGFGFVVARFGLFLKEIAPIEGFSRPGGWSPWFGTALILLGVGVNVLGALEYQAVIRRIDQNLPYEPPRWSLGLIVAGVLAAIGVAMAGYLVSL